MKTNFWKDKNVLVTGCYGFVSSWLIIKLIKNKARVIGVTNEFDPNSLLRLTNYDKKISIAHHSITEYESMLRVFNQYEIQFCFHLAAQTVESVCTHSPLTTFETNIKGTWTILEAARNCKTLQAIIIASSDKVYGEQKELPYHEDQLLLGCYPYDVSKVCDELLAKSYYHTFGLPIGITRCANIYGGGDFHWSRIISGTIRSILNNEAPIIRSDGTPIRDYLYAEDTVNAFLTLIKAVSQGKVKGEAFNFSSESPISVLDLVNLIIKVSGKTHLKPKILGKGKPEKEIDKQALSCEKARRLLKWKAKYPPKKGLKKTIEWYKNIYENTPYIPAYIR